MVNITILMGIYTAIILGGIYYYEAKLKDLHESISDYKRALNIAKGSDNHYTYVQLENAKLRRDMQYLSEANDHLQNEVRSLRHDNQELLNGTFGQYKGYSVGPVNMPAYTAENGKLVSMGGNQDIQYESSVYKNNQWESSIERIIEI